MRSAPTFVAAAGQATVESSMQVRPIVRATRGIQTSDGAGVRLRRLMGSGAAIPSIDPFLMLDYFDSPDASDYIAGFPPHPHRYQATHEP